MAASSSNPFQPATALGEDLIRYADVRIGWVVERLIPEATVSIIAGAPSSFKSWTANHIALCVTSGALVFGEFVVPAVDNVILFAGDDAPREYIPRFARLIAGMGGVGDEALLRLQTRHIPEPLNLGFPACRKQLEQAIQGFGLCILDPQIHFAVGVDENKANEMQAFLGGLRAVAENTNCAILLVHHTRKMQKDAPNSFESLRGSSAIRGACRSLMMLKAKPHVTQVEVEVECRYAPDLPPFAVQFKLGEDVATVEVAAVDRSDQILGLLAANSEQGLTPQEIAEACGITETHARTQLQRLAKAHKARILASEGRSKKWGLAVPEMEGA